MDKTELLKQLRLVNASKFAAAYGLPLRTITRLRSESPGEPTAGTIALIEAALRKEANRPKAARK